MSPATERYTRRVASVKLHRCSWTFLHTDLDACWKVQRALDEQGIPYEIVKHGFGKGARPAVEALSGQKWLPVIEFEDGTRLPRRVRRDGGARARRHSCFDRSATLASARSCRRCASRARRLGALARAHARRLARRLAELAKKGAGVPSVTYAEALDGGALLRLDRRAEARRSTSASGSQRFTPRGRAAAGRRSTATGSTR